MNPQGGKRIELKQYESLQLQRGDTFSLCGDRFIFTLEYVTKFRHLPSVNVTELLSSSPHEWEIQMNKIKEASERLEEFDFFQNSNSSLKRGGSELDSERLKSKKLDSSGSKEFTNHLSNSIDLTIDERAIPPLMNGNNKSHHKENEDSLFNEDFIVNGITLRKSQNYSSYTSEDLDKTTINSPIPKLTNGFHKNNSQQKYLFQTKENNAKTKNEIKQNHYNTRLQNPYVSDEEIEIEIEPKKKKKRNEYIETGRYSFFFKKND